MSWLINATQLEKFRKSQKSLIILDASWHLPTAERNAKQEFIEKHIIGAQFLDLNLFHDDQAPNTNMLIHDEKIISEKLGALGIRDDYKIIFYDNSDLHTACRALWMMRIFGHNPHQLYILDGGLAAWEKQKGKIASGEVIPSVKKYHAKFQPHLLRSLTEMKANINHPTEQVVDLRHALRFAGSADPRPNTRPGHIPDSFCIPYTSFFDIDGRFLSLEKIRRLLLDLGISLSLPIITTCGSGITAPILNFILDLLEHPQHGLYEGSWAEWGSEKLYPGETSLDERPVVQSLDIEV